MNLNRVIIAGRVATPPILKATKSELAREKRIS